LAHVATAAAGPAGRLGTISSARERSRYARGDPWIREAKLVGFVILLAVIFVAAHAVGSRLGPVQAGHARVSYPGMSGMNMGANPSPSATGAPSLAPAARLRGAAG
jgi:hypothetical protein